MAELLVRVVSRANPSDVYKDVKLTKRGDVICAQPDGWAWSDIEKTYPEWRIFKWPSVTLTDVAVFLSPEIDTAPSPLGIENPMLQARAFCIDVDLATLPAALRNYLADDTRAAPFFNVPAQITVATVKKQRAKRADPSVIG